MYHITKTRQDLYQKKKHNFSGYQLDYYEICRWSCAHFQTYMYTNLHANVQSCSFGINTNTNPNQLPPNASQTRSEHKFK